MTDRYVENQKVTSPNVQYLRENMPNIDWERDWIDLDDFGHEQAYGIRGEVPRHYGLGEGTIVIVPNEGLSNIEVSIELLGQIKTQQYSTPFDLEEVEKLVKGVIETKCEDYRDEFEELNEKIDNLQSVKDNVLGD